VGPPLFFPSHKCCLLYIQSPSFVIRSTTRSQRRPDKNPFFFPIPKENSTLPDSGTGLSLPKIHPSDFPPSPSDFPPSAMWCCDRTSPFKRSSPLSTNVIPQEVSFYLPLPPSTSPTTTYPFFFSPISFFLHRVAAETQQP